MAKREPATMEEYRTVTLDLSTVTVGELAKVEIASGMAYDQILRSRMGRKMMAMFIHELRSSEQPRSWQELSNLRLLDALSSTSPASPDGASGTSKD